MKQMAISKRLAAMVFSGAALVCASAMADVPAKDWPSFNGPARDNISKETGLLKQWPKGGPPLAWKAKGIGDGHSSVVVANGKIFTAGKEGDSTFVFALNESDGKQVWKHEAGGIGRSNEGQGGKGPRATPTVDGDNVYMISASSDVYCLSAADGKDVWHKNLNKDFGGRMMSGWGNSESVLVDGENVICTPGGKNGTLLALDKKTGNPVWQTKELTDAAAYSSPLSADIGGVHQIIVLTSADLAGVDAKDGKVLWKVSRPGKTAVIPTPIVHDNYVYVTSGYGVGCDLFKVNYEAGKFSVESIYTKNMNMIDHHGGVIYLDGNIYGHSDSKGWICQDMMTGAIKWASKALDKGTIAYADGHFYCRAETRKGTIALIEASPDGWKETGRFDQPDRSDKQAWPHLVIANGKLYVRDMDTLLCYDIKAK
jgi:outer membrane protein assembly factor BamB